MEAKLGSFLNSVRRAVYIITAILAGICLFASFSAFSINRTVLNSDFHKRLFEKNNIYYHAHNVVSSSLSKFINDFKKNSPEVNKQHMDVFMIIDRNITPEMINTNLDSLREGIFQYFKGERMFLPDIHLNMQTQTDKGNQDEPSAALKAASQAFAKIDKINLSVILLYINRSDIAEQLFIIKFIYYLIGLIPGLGLLLVLLLLIAGLILCKKPVDAFRWIATLLLTSCIAGIIAGLGLLTYIHFMMPGGIYPLTVSLPLDNEVIISYLKDSLIPVSIFMIVSGIILAAVSITTFMLPNLFPSIFLKDHVQSVDMVESQKMQRVLRNVIYVFLLVLLASSVSLKLQTFKKDFDANNFASAVEKLTNTNKVTQVISARDEGIYTVHIKLVDSKTNDPVPNAEINISGKSSISDKDFNQASITDETGTARFSLDNGNFMASFIPSKFPPEYQLPSSFFFDLKTAGTTIITINLDTIPPEPEPAWGIVEIEVLDKTNKPVPDLELTINGIVAAPGNPNSLYSYTNADGIAVFKLIEGTYTAAFVDSKFPKQFIMPLPIEVKASVNSVTRYTMQMVEDDMAKE